MEAPHRKGRPWPIPTVRVPGAVSLRGPPPTILPHDDRVEAWSVQLTAAHDRLRRELKDLRDGLDGDDAGTDLLGHCLAFCGALDCHHTDEDGGLFVVLQRARPDLEPVLADLVQDHHVIAGILRSVRGLADEAVQADAGRQLAVSRELDGLAAIVESHFRYEERAIAAALDALETSRPADGDRDALGHDWTRSVFGPVPPSP